MSSLKISIKKMRHGFVDEIALITATLITSCHWKIFVPFFLWKKRPENAFLTLIVKSYRKTNYAIQNNNKKLAV